MWNAHRQIINGKYDDALHGLANVVPSAFSKYEYLFFYTIGLAAGYRGSEQLHRWVAQSRNADGMLGITAEERYEYYRNNEDCQLAKKSLYKSIEFNPNFSPAHKELAECLAEKARFDKAFVVADSLEAVS